MLDNKGTPSSILQANLKLTISYANTPPKLSATKTKLSLDAIENFKA